VGELLRGGQVKAGRADEAEQRAQRAAEDGENVRQLGHCQGGQAGC